MQGRNVFGETTAAVWTPGPEHLTRSRLARAMTKWGYDSLPALQAASVDQPDWFWRAVVEDLQIPLKGVIDDVCLEAKGRAFPTWFNGATINIVESCVDRHAADPASADRQAVVYEADSGARRSLTFAQLKTEVDAFAAALKRLGVEKGDRVGLFLPPVPESAVAVYGAAKIGAVIVPAFSGYGAEPLASRLNAAKVKVLVTADSTTRRGKPVMMKAIADDAVALSPSVERIIVVTNSGVEVAMTADRDHCWDDLRVEPAKIEDPVALDPNHPSFILYTSGTTGAPKGIVHSQAGFLTKASVDFGYSFDLQQDDVLCWICDIGWMLGPMMILAGLHLGSTIVMIEGLPDFPEVDRLWTIVERNKGTVLGVAPTAARGLRSRMEGRAPAADLSTLRAFTSTGEAWDVPTWHWLFEDIGGKQRPILNYTGGTETGGGILSCYTIAPLAPASFTGPLPGMDVDVIDADGSPSTGIGELAVRNTWPGMAHSFWGDDQRYLETYWDRLPDIWVHGDLASIDANGNWHVHGRSDDTLKISGRRVGPAEIESALVAQAGVAEAAVIGVPDPVRGQRIVAFVSRRGDVPSLDEGELLAAAIVALGKGLAPSVIHVVAALPKTKNGKIMRRAIRSRYLDQPAGDMSALDPATPLENIPVLATEAG